MGSSLVPNPQLLLDRTVAIVGYGNQGRAQALNLRDSGARVVVGLRESSAHRGTAEAEGLSVLPIEEAVAGADIVAMLVPDMKMAEAYEGFVRIALGPGSALLFAHGFAILSGMICPREDVDVVLVSPKGVGTGVRRKYEEGSGVPGLVAVHQDVSGRARDLALAYAWGIGCGRSLLMETTFREETETDLFGEQVVLCGGIPNLISAAFETLLEAGYTPEIAYFETLYETKLIVDLIVERGIAGMREAISDTAQWGGLTAGTRIVTDETRQAMRETIESIRSGKFAEGWLREARLGSHTLDALKSIERGLAVERTGAEVRKAMEDA
ncbi:MAG: ketol-acid reductoisomerase [Armatimonadetes bacterium]|nr:ketol-acid reductoisomerase [Armatimonadota bacterium]